MGGGKTMCRGGEMLGVSTPRAEQTKERYPNTIRG